VIEIDPQETPVQFFGRCAAALAAREATHGYTGDGPTAVELGTFYKVCEEAWSESHKITWRELLAIYKLQSDIVDKWAFRETDPIATALYPVIEEVHYRIRLLLDEQYPETADTRLQIESARIVVYRAHQLAVQQEARKAARRKFWKRLLLRASLLTMTVSVVAFAKTAHAPLPESLLNAKTVYLDNEGSTSSFDKAYSEFQKWGKYTIVPTKEAADLTVVFTTGSKLIDGTAYDRTTMKVFPKESSQLAFEATNRQARECVAEFKKRLAAD
jgi:hypothetical protein